MRGLALVVVSVLAGAAPVAQAPGTPPTPEYPTSTSVVSLDVIVRQKTGRPVRDLRADEIAVQEDGTLVEIQSFRFVAAPEGAETSAVPDGPTASGRSAATSLPRLTTLVFDALDLEGARLARRTAFDLLARGSSSATLTAVFRIGDGLRLVQPFTAEAETLRKAVEAATAGARTASSATRGAQKAATEARRVANPDGVTGFVQNTDTASEATIALAPNARDDALAPVLARLLEVTANALRLADALERQQQGTESLHGLLGLLKAQEGLPGRKSVVYFSGGLRVPPPLEDVFKAAISTANRAGVSIYAVDTRGLDAASEAILAAQALRSAMETSRSQLLKGAGEAISREEVMTMDTAESSLRLDSQGTLRDLAESTGGFLLANANDLRAGVDRIVSDLAGYYEMTYVSPRAELDGKFRNIAVKVSRKGVTVQSRRGYFALPPSEAIILPHESPLLAALAAPTPPHDFEQRAAVLRFGPDGAAFDHEVIVEVPLRPFTFVQDRKKKTFALHLSVLTLIKAEDGRIAERFSEDYPLSGPLDQLEGMRRSHTLLRGRARLKAGHYVLETAARDRATGQTSVERVPFEVAQRPGLGLSSLCLVRRAEPLGPRGNLGPEPMQAKGLRLVPRLGEPISKAEFPEVTLFATVYPAPVAEEVWLDLEFLRDGEIVRRAEPELSPADDDGVFRYVGAFPTNGLEPGRYEVRLRATQGEAETEERTAFILER